MWRLVCGVSQFFLLAIVEAAYLFTFLVKADLADSRS